MSLLDTHRVRIGEIDITPFLDTAKILYEGALVAERYSAFGEFIQAHPESADPTVATIALRAKDIGAADFVRDQQKVHAMRTRTMTGLRGFDAMLLPTAPTHPSIEAVRADPIGVNSLLGTYTNFVNLLDLAVVAVPAGRADSGRFGVSVIVRAFDDQVAIDLAAKLTGERDIETYPTGGIPLAVFGAHLSGQPLNHQLIAAGARPTGPVTTSPSYRMYALPGPIPKPAVVRTPDGVPLRGELWSVPPAGLGTSLAELPAPMTLGKIELADGRWAVGFGCSDPAGEDISQHGGWLAYLNAH